MVQWRMTQLHHVLGRSCARVRADGTGYELAIELSGGRVDLVFDADVTGILRGCRQVLSVGVRPDRIDEEGWELLDQVQDLQLVVGLAGVTPR